MNICNMVYDKYNASSIYWKIIIGIDDQLFRDEAHSPFAYVVIYDYVTNITAENYIG